MRIFLSQRMRVSRSMPGRPHAAGSRARASVRICSRAASGVRSDCARARDVSMHPRRANASRSILLTTMMSPRRRSGRELSAPVMRRSHARELDDMHVGKGVRPVTVDRAPFLPAQHIVAYAPELFARDVDQTCRDNSQIKALPAGNLARAFEVDLSTVRDHGTSAWRQMPGQAGEEGIEQVAAVGPARAPA